MKALFWNIILRIAIWRLRQRVKSLAKWRHRTLRAQCRLDRVTGGNDTRQWDKL